MKPLRIQFALALAAALLAMPLAIALADEASDQFAVAAGHYAAKRWELAAEEFQRFLDGYPDHPQRTKALFFCGEALVQSGKFSEAQAQFVAVLEVGQASRRGDTAAPPGRYERQALFRAGECAFWASKSQDAVAWLTKFHKQYPEDPLDAYVLSYLGELALRAEDAAAAKAHYSEAVKRFPQAATADDCRLGLAQAHLRLKEHREAEAILAPLLKEERLAVATNYWLGQIHKAQEQWDRAAQAFQAAIAADPEHSSAQTLRYQAAESFLRAERFQAAIDVLHGGAAPANAKLLAAEHAYLVALAQQGLGKHDEALTTLDRLADEKGGELALNVSLSRATSLVALARHRDAIGPLNQYLAALGGVGTAQRNRALAQLALCHARINDFDKAKATLDQLTATAPHSELTAATTLQIAEIAAAAKQTTWAASLFEAAADERSPANIAAAALLRWAQLMADTGDLNKGASLLERLLQRYPDGEQAVNAALACARLRERLEEYDAALAMYNLVIEKHADDGKLPEALLGAAALCDRLSQDAKAIELYSRLAGQFTDSPHVPAAIYGWAWCLRDLGREADSNEKFEQLHRDYGTAEYWPDATYRLALSAAQSKSFDRAIALLSKLIDVSEEGPAARAPAVTAQHALYLRAQIAIAQKKWDDAQRDLERLLAEHATSPLVLPAEFLRADVVYRRGDYDQAGKRFAELSPKIKGRQDRWIPMVALRRAQVLAQEKRWSEARAIAETIAHDYPAFDQQFEVDYLIGRAFAAEANLTEARQWYQKVVRSVHGGKTETAAMAQWMIGETYFLQEQYPAAIREYLRVEVLYAYPHWQAAALLQAGKCWEQAGQWKDASEAYSRLLARYSQTQFAAEARERLQNLRSRTASRANHIPGN